MTDLSPSFISHLHLSWSYERTTICPHQGLPLSSLLSLRYTGATPTTPQQSPPHWLLSLSDFTDSVKRQSLTCGVASQHYFTPGTLKFQISADFHLLHR